MFTVFTMQRVTKIFIVITFLAHVVVCESPSHFDLHQGKSGESSGAEAMKSSLLDATVAITSLPDCEAVDGSSESGTNCPTRLPAVLSTEEGILPDELLDCPVPFSTQCSQPTKYQPIPQYVILNQQEEFDDDQKSCVAVSCSKGAKHANAAPRAPSNEGLDEVKDAKLTMEVKPYVGEDLTGDLDDHYDGNPVQEIVSEEHWRPVQEIVSDERYGPVHEIVSEEHESPVQEIVSEEHWSSVQEFVYDEPESPMQEIVSEEHESPVQEIVSEEHESPVQEIVSEEHESPVHEIVSGEHESPVQEIVSEEHENPVQEIVSGEHERPVQEIVSEEQFKMFTKNTAPESPIRIVFYHNEGVADHTTTPFLVLYGDAAAQLLPYDIRLATVSCGSVPHSKPCQPPRVGRYCYGYKAGHERIAFPLHAVSTVDALVASVLHLSAIDAVPIIQSGRERQALERRCAANCNIFLARLAGLGTQEHRGFLEAVFRYLLKDDLRPKLAFAIATGKQAINGLPQQHGEVASGASAAWLLQCADGPRCSPSRYRGALTLPALEAFLDFLRQPLWATFDPMSSSDAGLKSSVSEADGTAHLLSRYWRFGVSQVVMVYDSDTHQRVVRLAPQLAQLVRGGAAVTAAHVDALPDDVFAALGISKTIFAPPAILFYPPYSLTPRSHMVKFEAPQDWVEDQLSLVEPLQDPNDPVEEYSALLQLEEMQQDDEVVLAMVREGALRAVPPLQGHEDLAALTRQGGLVAVAYIMSWDAGSNLLLQHLCELVPSMRALHSHAVLRKADCFDYPALCSNVSRVPQLSFIRGAESITYSGPYQAAAMLKALLTLESAWSVLEVPEHDVEQFLNLTLVFALRGVAETAVLGVFGAREDAQGFLAAAEGLRGQVLLGLTIVPEQRIAALCGCHKIKGCAEGGCLLTTKTGDRFQRHLVATTNITTQTEVEGYIAFSTQPVMSKLEPQRLSSLLTLKKERGGDKTPLYLVLLLLPDADAETLQAGSLRMLDMDDGRGTDGSRRKGGPLKEGVEMKGGHQSAGTGASKETRPHEYVEEEAAEKHIVKKMAEEKQKEEGSVTVEEEINLVHFEINDQQRSRSKVDKNSQRHTKPRAHEINRAMRKEDNTPDNKFAKSAEKSERYRLPREEKSRRSLMQASLNVPDSFNSFRSNASHQEAPIEEAMLYEGGATEGGDAEGKNDEYGDVAGDEDESRAPRDKVNSLLDLHESVGRAAGEMRRPGLQFAWMRRDSRLAQAALSAWRLEDHFSPLVAVDLNAGTVTSCRHWTGEARVRTWIRQLSDGALPFTRPLPPRAWQPALHGLDYLRLLEEGDEEGEYEGQP